MDIEKLKNDLKRTESKMDNDENITVNFEYLKQDKEYTGLFIVPLSNSDEEQDIYTLNEVYKFGNKYIQNTPSNQNHLASIQNLDEYINKYSKLVRDDWKLSYSKINSIKIGLFNPKNNPSITILTISYYNRINDFLKQLYSLYEKYQDDLYKLIITITLKNKQITITPKSKLEDPYKILSKSFNDVEKMRKAVNYFLTNQKDLEISEIKSITQNWINQVIKSTSSDSEGIHFEGSKIQSNTIKYDDDFFENLEKEEPKNDLFDEKKNPSPVDLEEDLDIPF